MLYEVITNSSFNDFIFESSLLFIDFNECNSFLASTSSRITSYNVCYTKLLRTNWISKLKNAGFSIKQVNDLFKQRFEGRETGNIIGKISHSYYITRDKILKESQSKKDKFIEFTNFEAWAYTIMKNTFINNYRKAVRQNSYNFV